LEDLDKYKVCSARLFREHCTFCNGIFVKDLSRLGRRLQDVIIVDVRKINKKQNSPTAYLFHPENALPSISWYDDMTCNELIMMIPILEALSRVEDVRPYLNMIVKENRVLFTKAAQVLRGGKVTERSNSQ
jgi:RNA polymerase II subunit A small phosphatase-like protein